LDYETATSHTVTVQAESSDGSTEESSFTIDVLDNQPPRFSANKGTMVAENIDASTVVHTAQATDADGDQLTYKLGGTDKDAFRIDQTTGEVRFVSSPDYETQSSYDFTVTASDGYLSAVQNVSVDIFNIDEVVQLGSAELASGGTFAGEGLDDTMDGSTSTVSLDMSGGGGNDIMTGGSADDVLDGGAGNDELNGGDGDDVIITGGGLDRVDGGDGIDTVVLESNAGDIVSVNLSREWQYSGDGWNYIANVENVTTGGGEDIIQGNDIANVLDSGGGDDWLYAGGGDDVLIGGAGTDRLFGGDGNDTVVFESGDNLTVDLNSEWQVGNLNTSEGMDKIMDVENVTTGAGNDTLIGNADANVLTGGGGDDTLTGGDGADVFRFFASEGMTTDVITDFKVGEDRLELVNDTTDIIGDAVITTDANGSTVTWDELTIVLDVVITKDDINPIV
jgi:Ca2+-binding RTX toxin-like protein